MRRICFYTVAAVSFVLAVCGVASATEKQREFGYALAAAEKLYAGVTDYACVIRKKISIQGVIKEEFNTVYKHMKPGHFYVKWTEGDKAGSEAIYVDGKYNNKVRAHKGGLLSFADISIDPKGKMAMKDNLHPIYESGFGFMLYVLRKDYDLYLKNRDAVISYEGMSSDGRLVFKGVFPQGKGYYGHIVTVYMEPNSYLPTGISVYGWNKEFIEEYHYDQVQLNAGLTVFDFDPKNPAYGY